MSSALDAFRAQREAVDQVHARLTELAELLRNLQVRSMRLRTTRPFASSCGTNRPGSNKHRARSPMSDHFAKKRCVASGPRSGDGGPLLLLSR
jgi:hypothetical protein